MQDLAVATPSWDADEALRGVLDPGEVVLWSGVPFATRGLDPQDVWFTVLGLWISLIYLAVAYFDSATHLAVALRVLPPSLSMAYIVVVRPAVRRSQRQRTAFALTPMRAIALSEPPFRTLEIAMLPSPYQVWRRTDGRGSITFGMEPSSNQRPSQAAAVIPRIILFLLGFAPWPRRKADQLVFYEVRDIDDVVRILETLPQSELSPSTPARLPGEERRIWSQVVERRFSPTRRVICGLLGVVLAATMIPVIAVRLRDYLDHSPTLSGQSTVRLALPPATYVIFEHTEKAGPYDCSPVSVCVTIGPSNVSVTSQAGERLSAFVDPSMDGITDGNAHYAGALKFNVRESGTYFISIRSSATATFVIAKQPSEEAFALGGWIAGGSMGLILIVTALLGSLIARGRKSRND